LDFVFERDREKILIERIWFLNYWRHNLSNSFPKKRYQPSFG